MANDVFDKADALMQRHRSYVARPAAEAAPAAPVPAPEATPEEDLPLLTEVVDATADAGSQADALEQALSDWLVEVLPAAVANASQRILAELDARARATLLPRLREIAAESRTTDTPPDAPQGD